MEEPQTELANRSEDSETLGPISSDTSLRSEADRLELPLPRFWALTIGLLTGLLLSFLDTSIIATSLFAIATEFHVLESVNWVALAYCLAYLGCATLLAQISDIVGRHNAFIASYFIFITFSIACGFSQTLNQLIACRAMQGLGGSGLYSITMIILPEVSPRRMERFVGGLIGIAIATSSVLGPVLGGILTQYVSWRWVFWINGPIGAFSAFLFYFTWPKPHYLPNLERKSWKELDYVGSILLIAAAVLVVFPFQNIGIMVNQWSKAVFIAPLVVGLVLWLGLFLWSFFIDQRRGRIDAALPVRLLRDPVYAAALLNTLFLGFPYMLVVYAFPLKLQMVHDKSALISGLMLLPMLGFSAVGSVISGAINTKRNKIFETLFAGTCLMVLGCGLLSTLSNSYKIEPKSLGFLVFVGLGFGMVVSTATIAATYQSSTRDHAPAQGLMAQARVLGGSIGLTVSSAIVGVMLQDKIDLSRSGLLFHLGGGPDATQSEMGKIRDAYSDAFNEDMRVCTIIGGIALVFSLGTYTSSRNRLTLEERREQQLKEMEGRKASQSSQALGEHTPV
ncbi:major facilitator superfamily transporter [Hypomontagnella submonticulosa]|nr:major facilitator superfamily transporter [Hypomontagnella submonticulosa]